MPSAHPAPAPVAGPVSAPVSATAPGFVQAPDAAPAPARTPVAGSARGQAPSRGRDLFVDAVRALGTLGVLGLHWSMADATLDDAGLHLGNALASGPGWLLTWLLPLPLLFFAAGAAAQHERTRTARGTPALMAHRLRRLAPPVALLLGTWGVAGVALRGLGLPHDVVAPVLRTVPQPLWFLGVYLVLTAATPAVARGVGLLARGHRHRRPGAPRPVHAVLVVLAVLVVTLAVDALRIGGAHPAVGAVNLLLVWSLPFAAGVAHACGVRPRRAVLLAGLLGGLAGAVALVALGPYPASLVGMPGQAISNLSPPTTVVAAFSLAQVCGALLARDALVRAAGTAHGGRVVAWVGARSMTLYLWHLTAMFVVAGTVLVAARLPLPTPWTTGWWLTRPLWLAASVLVLAALVRCAAPAERRRPPGVVPPADRWSAGCREDARAATMDS